MSAALSGNMGDCLMFNHAKRTMISLGRLKKMFLIIRTAVKAKLRSSVADPGYLFRIPDPNFFHPGSEIFLSRIRIRI
jgi:hypothetical protein